LGFTFPFYGVNNSSVLISSAGYLDLGPVYHVTSQNNVQLPTADQRDAVIAPYWDDLSPTSGCVRTKMLGTSPNRYFIIEWNGVERTGDPGSSVTFQAVLYESGKIEFRYGSLTGGTAPNGASATVGIENDSGTGGVQYSYNQSDAVTSGTVITFDRTMPPADADADGMPDAIETLYLGSTSASPNGDDDGDGQINSAELYAGTDPSDPGSLLQFEGTQQLATNNCVLRWQSVPGRYYDVYKATSPTGTWSKLNVSPCVGAAGTTQYTVDTSSGTSACWRVTAP
jgi:hypothetical protein